MDAAATGSVDTVKGDLGYDAASANPDGPGFNGPINVVVDLPAGSAPEANQQLLASTR